MDLLGKIGKMVTGDDNAKVASMEHDRLRFKDGDELSTNQGVKIVDNQNSLKAGARGPTLLEDFFFREKMNHFDHERNPERIVHARGAAAHGYFQVYESLAPLTNAHFLQDPRAVTPVFVRFSTVGGNKGSADTVRDVRGFATKFYTEEGNFDIVGNNMPVFFVQDAVKFPDFVHAVKPEPDNEMPQASSAHDNFWDFVTQQPESTHMLMWLMSDRALPRAYANMEGFGVHTFRLINAQGVARFVKFHWKPKLGVHSLLWDETQKLAGKNSDFNRQDLWESIEAGQFPEWELGLQIVEEADEHKFDFDLLDPTKIIPEELVPVKIVGKMVLNRNPDNFFAETEQVAYMVQNIVPGIDFTNDPLMQGRLFSYLDTQMSRLGGPNFHEIPINRPICPFRINHQRDGLHRQTINVGKQNYDITGIHKHAPKEASKNRGGFVSYTERIDANKIRLRSPSFADHFSQATLFWKSMSLPEQNHIVQAFTFELSKVQEVLRQRMINQLQNVDAELTRRVAFNIGLVPDGKVVPGYPKAVKPSPALSQATTRKDSVETRKVAILAADGADGMAISDMKKTLENAGCTVKLIAPHMGKLRVVQGTAPEIDGFIMANPSILFDAIFIPGGAESIQALLDCGQSKHFALETYIHCKAIAAAAEGVEFLVKIGLLNPGGAAVPLGMVVNSGGAVSEDFAMAFVANIKKHRFYDRERITAFPA